MQNMEIIQNIFEIMEIIGHNFLRDAAKEVLGKDLSFLHLKIIHILFQKKLLAMSELGETIFVTKPHMTILVDRLIELGIVARHTDDDDRRKIMIALTKKGKDYVNKSWQIISEEAKKKLNLLSEKEIAKLAESLNTMKKIMQKVKVK